MDKVRPQRAWLFIRFVGFGEPCVGAELVAPFFYLTSITQNHQNNDSRHISPKTGCQNC
jgi:hypothetical protein